MVPSRSRSTLAFLALASVLALPACRANEVPALEAVPSTTALTLGETAKLEVSRHFFAGPIETVTDRVVYVSSNRSVVTVSDKGLVTTGTEAGVVAVHISDPSTDATTSVTFTVREPLRTADAGTN